jgi:hypothetical protein
MAHYPIIKLPHEYMLIASGSGLFAATANGFQNDQFYIGNSKCGWNGCDLDVLTQITREYTDPIDVNFANCSIKNPIDLIPGDLVTLCGTASCKGVSDGTGFGAAIEYVDCAQVDNNEFQTVYGISSVKNFVFTKSFVCWSITYKIPNGLYLPKCQIAFIAGFSANVDAQVKMTWTLNIDRGNYSPPVPPFQ